MQEDIQKDMRQRMKEIRKIHKLSQKELGERLNLSQGQIGSYENGHRNIPDRTIKDICKEFKISEEWFKTGEGEMYDLSDASDFVETLINTENNDTIKQIMQEIALLDQEYLEAILTLVKGITLSSNKEK